MLRYAFACLLHYFLDCAIKERDYGVGSSCPINGGYPSFPQKHSQLPQLPETVSKFGQNTVPYPPTHTIFSLRSIPIKLCTMFNSTDLYQQVPPPNPTYPIPMPPYSYGVQTYGARGPREGFLGHSEKERDNNKRPSHIFPQKTHRQASTKRNEEPIDGRYFHIQMGYVPVQIVDADRARHHQRGGDRDDRAREERRSRTERREDVTTTLRQTCETTDIWRQFPSPSPGQLRNRHHRHSTRVYQTDPGESSKFLVRKQEYVTRVKEVEMYQPRREKVVGGHGHTHTGPTTRLGPNEYHHPWGRGFIRTRDS